MVRYHHRSSILEVGSTRVSVTIPGIVAVGLIILFLVVSINTAYDLKRMIVPDEDWHIKVSELFAKTWAIPVDTPETYPLGIISQKPFLYHWINGRLLNVVHLILPEPGNYKILVTLRLIGVLYSTLTVIYCYLLSKEIIKNLWWQVMPVFLLTSTLMFVLHSSGVNYDSLTNLLAIAGIYYLVKLLKGEEYYTNTLLWMILVLAGTITKLTNLPLLVIMGIAWAVYTFKNRRNIDFHISWNWKLISLFAVLALLVVLNFLIFGVNLIKYRAVIPACDMILSESECNQNPVFRRDKRVEKNLSISEMFNGNETDPFTWVGDWWLSRMITMTYGFAGHRWFNLSDMVITLYRWWFLVMALLVVRYWKNKPAAVVGLAAVVVFYILALIQTNLSAELKSGFRHIGIQGRYTFPVIGSLYVLFIYHAEQIRSRVASGALAVATVALFLLNSPVWVLNVPADMPYPSTQISPEEASVVLASGSMEVIQDFQSECSGALTDIEVLVAADLTPSAAPVKMVLSDLEGQQVIAEQEAVSQPGSERMWLSFPLNSLQNTESRHLRITLSAESVPNDLPLKLWNTTTNVYLFGDAIIKGQPTNKDLIFRYTCSRPALKDWFNE